MTIQPTLEIHPHQEFHFADNTEGKGCCCCWRFRPRRPKEYYVNERGVLVPITNPTDAVGLRILANQRLARLVESKFENDPVESHEAFKRLRQRVNHDFDNGDKITDEKLVSIVNAIYQVKEEIKRERR